MDRTLHGIENTKMACNRLKNNAYFGLVKFFSAVFLPSAAWFMLDYFLKTLFSGPISDRVKFFPDLDHLVLINII